MDLIRSGFLIFFIAVLNSCGGDSSLVSLSQNSPPTISGSIASIRVGESFVFFPISNDEDGDTLTFSITGAPDYTTFNTTNGSLTGVPSENDLGTVSSIVISVTDGEFIASTEPFELTVTAPIFFLNIEIDTMDFNRNMDFELSGCLFKNSDINCSENDELLTITENGIFPFVSGLETGSFYELKVDRDPGRQECSLAIMEGFIESEDRTIRAVCQPDESSAVFALDKLHKIRLTMTIDEWDRFILDTERAQYSTGDAYGNAGAWSAWTHSEVYRQVDFEYLDQQGNTMVKLQKVGFKMKGNTSRQWPEYFDDEGNFKPKRFSFGLKFDEEFDEDESVYSCIDLAGSPAAVSSHHCHGIIGKDLEEVPENDGRAFMGMEKVSFRFNRDDPSYQRELLAHDILNSIGVPTSRVSHANIELQVIGDGDFYGNPTPQTFNMGVYQMVEQIDKLFLKRYFGKNGYLFKISAGDLAKSIDINPSCLFYEDSVTYIDANFCRIGVEKSDPVSREEWLGVENYLNPAFVNSNINDGGEESQFRPYKPHYDLKSKKKSIKDGRRLLQDFISLVQSDPSVLALEEQFDVKGFIKAQAAEIAIGAVDHYVRLANNYYLYFNPISHKWIYMVSDFDYVFRDHHPLSWGDEPSWAEAFRDITSTYAFPSDGKVYWAGRSLGEDINPILWNIVFDEQANRDLLYSEIKSILDNHMDWDTLTTTLSERNSLVETAINDTDAGLPDAPYSGGCQVIYNPEAIDADAGTVLCDSADISIKRFIELRKIALENEMTESGFLGSSLHLLQ